MQVLGVECRTSDLGHVLCVMSKAYLIYRDFVLNCDDSYSYVNS